MATATKDPKAAVAQRAEKTAFAVLGVVEKAGKELTLLAREGRKRIRAYERKTAPRPRKRMATT